MNFKALPLSRPLAVFLIAALLAYLSQLQHDLWRRYSPPKIGTSYNLYIEPQPLSAATARIVSFGATEFMADLYWLRTIQYYGGGDPYGKYRKLAELFHLVTDLAPKFVAPYQTGLIILPGEGFIDEAIALGEKGKKNLPERWEIPYYTGLVYHIYKKDYRQAAAQFEASAALPGAPANAKYFAGIYYNQAQDRRTAYLMFKNVAESSSEQFVRERAQLYLKHLEIIFFLEDAAKIYRERFGQKPERLEQLVEKRVIKEIPESPLSRKFTINPQTGEIGEVIKK